VEITDAPTCLNPVAFEIRAALIKEENKPFLSFEDYQTICNDTVFTK